MPTLKLNKKVTKLLLYLVCLVHNALHGEAQAVISVQIQTTSSYHMVANMSHDIYNKFQEDLFNTNVSTITLKYLYSGNGFISSIETIEHQYQKENLYYTCFVNEALMAIQCHKNISCTIQNCTSCITGIGIRWKYDGYISSKYITNKTEHCDDGQVIVMYTIIQNFISTSTVTSSTTSTHIITMIVREPSANQTLPESSSNDTDVDLSVPAIVAVSVSVTVPACVGLSVLIFFIHRKGLCKKQPISISGSQTEIRHNYDYLQSSNYIQEKDARDNMYNKPVFNLKSKKNSNNMNDDFSTVKMKADLEFSVYPNIDHDEKTAELNSVPLESEKPNMCKNYKTNTKNQEIQTNPNSKALNNVNEYDEIDYNQTDVNLTYLSLEINPLDYSYSNIGKPRVLKSNDSTQFRPQNKSPVQPTVDECGQLDQLPYNAQPINVSSYVNLTRTLEQKN